MSFIHSYTLKGTARASDLLGSRIEPPAYQVDVGCTTEALVPLVAVMRGIDSEGAFESLMGEIEVDMSETDRADEYVAIIASSIVAELAVGSESRIPELTAAWQREEFYHEPPDVLERRLRVLQSWCQRAVSDGQTLAIHSYE